MKLPLILALIALVWSSAMAVAGEKAHPIDQKIDALSDEARSTAEMIAAAEKGLVLWDKELNAAFQRLKGALEPAAVKRLQEAQRGWVEQRERDWKLIDAMYDEFEGTMYLPMRVHAKMRVVRTRALELQRLYEIQQEHGG